MNLRISTTILEYFRLCCVEEWASEAELVAKVKGESVAVSEAARFGTAVHALLEGTHDWTPFVDVLTSGEYDFDATDIERIRDMVPPAAGREVKNVLRVHTGMHEVDVVAKVDAVSGLQLWEYKNKLSSFTIGDYEPSLQWRCYLWVFSAAIATYNVCLWHERDGIATLKDAVPFSFFAYPGLDDDCRRWVRFFTQWAETKKLLPYLQREGTP